MTATFLQLKNLVLAALVDAAPFVQNQVGSLVNLAIRDFLDETSLRVMEAEAEYTTTALTRTLGAVPANWKEWRGGDRPYYKLESGLQPVYLNPLPDRNAALNLYAFSATSDKGQPRHLTMVPTDEKDAKNFEIWPLPDGLSDWTATPAGEYRIVIPYYKYLAELSADGDTNWVTIHGEQYVMHQATARGFVLDQDQLNAQTHYTLAKKFKRQLKVKAAAEQNSGNTTWVPRSDVFAPKNQWRRS